MAWAADLWWDVVADPNPAVDAMTIPHTPSRADLAQVRRRLTALHRQGSVVRTGHPARWQPLESSKKLMDDSVETAGPRPDGSDESAPPSTHRTGLVDG